MNKMFTQPTGPVAKQVNKQAIARVNGIKQSEVGILNTLIAIDSYKVLYDTDTQTSWFRGEASGIPTSWAVSGNSLTLVTSSGEFNLELADLRQNLASNELPGLSLVALAVSGNLSHAITGVYVDAFEADPTGSTDSSDAVIRAAKTLATMTTSGYDKNNKNYNVVIFGPGTYIIGDVPMFTGIRYVGQGPYATRIQPAEGCAYAFTTIGTTNVDQGTSSADRLFHSGVTNMSIGSGYQTTDAGSSNYTSPALNAGGIFVKNASYMTFEDLAIRFVDGCGLDCVELFDSDIKNVQLMSVGNDRDLNNIVPALRLMPDGDYSSTNAVRIDAMHIEECPKHMHIGPRTRHVFFTGSCKFEGGATTHSSTISGVNGVTFDAPELT